MIRINLLPQQKRAKVSNVEKEVVLYILIVLILGISVYFTNSWITTKVASLEQTKSQKQIAKNQLKRKTREIRAIKKQLKEITSRVDAIKMIRSKQGMPIRYLNQLVINLPQESIWFQSMQMRPDGTINLRGIAMDNQIFAEYVKTLRQSQFIRDVQLGQTSRKSVNNLGLIAFSCTIKTTDDIS
jgi:type IV pilus assembly protein PilN